MRSFTQNFTLECDISIPFESQCGPHLFLPRNVRLPKSGSGSGRAVGTDARRAARQETSPGAKPLVTIVLWGQVPNRENTFFGRGRQCFGSQVMHDQRKKKKEKTSSPFTLSPAAGAKEAHSINAHSREPRTAELGGEEV